MHSLSTLLFAGPVRTNSPLFVLSSLIAPLSSFFYRSFFIVCSGLSFADVFLLPTILSALRFRMARLCSSLAKFRPTQDLYPDKGMLWLFHGFLRGSHDLFPGGFLWRTIHSHFPSEELSGSFPRRKGFCYLLLISSPRKPCLLFQVENAFFPTIFPSLLARSIRCLPDAAPIFSQLLPCLFRGV